MTKNCPKCQSKCYQEYKFVVHNTGLPKFLKEEYPYIEDDDIDSKDEFCSYSCEKCNLFFFDK